MKNLLLFLVFTVVLTGCKEFKEDAEYRTIDYYFAIDTIGGNYYSSVYLLNSLLTIKFHIDSARVVYFMNVLNPARTVIVNKDVSRNHFYVRAEKVKEEPVFAITDTTQVDIRVYPKVNFTDSLFHYYILDGYAVDTAGDTLIICLENYPISTFFSLYLPSETSNYGINTQMRRVGDTLFLITDGTLVVPLGE